jgi:hypothetical protein
MIVYVVYGNLEYNEDKMRGIFYSKEEAIKVADYLNDKEGCLIYTVKREKIYSDMETFLVDGG